MSFYTAESIFFIKCAIRGKVLALLSNGEAFIFKNGNFLVDNYVNDIHKIGEV